MPHADPITAVASLGGIARVHDVRMLGPTKDAIRRAVLRQALTRPRYGVVALPDTPQPLLRAAAAGGALAGLSAARYYGVWTPSHAGLQLSVRGDAVRRVRHPATLFRDGATLGSDERFVVSFDRCLRQCIEQLPFDEAVALLDSALHAWVTGMGPSVDIAALRSTLPRRRHPVIDAADARSEAGAESLARVRLGRAGIVANPQVRVTHDIRVDLLIGDRLVIEIGSKEFHASPEQYERDHARAALLLALGFDILEFTTDQVMNDWPFVLGIIGDRARRATPQ